MKDKLIKMLALQAALNTQTLGSNWGSGLALNGKPISWHRGIMMKMAEFIDSFPWEHWKDIDKEPGTKNAITQIVDSWHFIVSEALVFSNGNIEEIANMFEGQYIISIEEKKLRNAGVEEIIEHVEREIITRCSLKESPIYGVSMALFDLCYGMHLSFDNLYNLYIGEASSI